MEVAIKDVLDRVRTLQATDEASAERNEWFELTLVALSRTGVDTITVADGVRLRHILDEYMVEYRDRERRNANGEDLGEHVTNPAAEVISRWLSDRYGVGKEAGDFITKKLAPLFPKEFESNYFSTLLRRWRDEEDDADLEKAA